MNRVTKFGINLVNRSVLFTFAPQIHSYMIQRILKQKLMEAYLRKKILVVLGPRQVGKSTLLGELVTQSEKVRMLNCDNEDDRRLLQDRTTTELQKMVAS